MKARRNQCTSLIHARKRPLRPANAEIRPDCSQNESGYGLAEPVMGKAKCRASAVLLQYHMKQRSTAFHAANAA